MSKGGRGRTPLPRAIHPLWFDKLTMSGNVASPYTHDATANIPDPRKLRTSWIRWTLPVALLILLAVGWLAPVAVAAAPLLDDPVAVEAALETATVRTGDHVKLTITATHPAGTRLQFPDAQALQATGLEVLRSQPGQGFRGLGGAQATSNVYTLAGFAPGVYPLPPLRMEYETPDGAKGVATAPVGLQLRVESVLAGLANPSLRDIRPPVAIPQPPGLLARPAAAAALVVALALLTVLLVRRWRRRLHAPALAPELATPEDRVRAKLRAAAELAAGAAPAYAAIYRQVSAAVRDYVEQRTGLPARTSTTRELRRAMERRSADRWHARIILGLLDECDAVQWAAYTPDAARAQRAITMAYEVVDLIEAAARPQTAPRTLAAGEATP
jgi:hypothetical protein